MKSIIDNGKISYNNSSKDSIKVIEFNKMYNNSKRNRFNACIIGSHPLNEVMNKLCHAALDIHIATLKLVHRTISYINLIIITIKFLESYFL